MRKTVLTFILAILSLGATAQMGTDKKAAKYIDELKQRPLLVFNYGDYDGFEETIKKAIEEVWTLSPSVKYISTDEWKALSKDKDEAKKYAYLHYTLTPLQSNAPASSILIGLLENKMSVHYKAIPDIRDDNYNSVADFMVTLKNLQVDLEMGDNYKNLVRDQTKYYSQFLKDSLAHKTLLIDKNNVSKKLLKEMDKLYQYPYQFVDKSLIDDAIINKQSDILFLREIFIAQRPRTKTREFAGVETTRTSSNGYALFYLYKASDLEIVGSTGFSNGELDPRGIQMLLTLMNY
ncbi:hypothetical protein ACU8DI_07015 [Psychroserpens sp. BH13MA-6]